MTHAVSPPLGHSEDFHRGHERASLVAAVSSGRRAVELARELYVAGLGDFRSVLEAQPQFAAEEALQNSETALRQHLVALYKAAGGGWEAISGAGPR